MDSEEKIKRLEEYKRVVLEWRKTHDDRLRSLINQNTVWVRREVVEARCFHTLTIGPPPAIGGLIARDVDPFAMMFDPPYRKDLVPVVVDMIDQTIGVLRAGPSRAVADQPTVQIDLDVEEGYAFVAMPMDPEDLGLADVLDAIKEAARRCGIHAERVDEPQYNDRITDRILESVRKAEFVIVDSTSSKPNVFYEAGYRAMKGSARGYTCPPIRLVRCKPSGARAVRRPSSSGGAKMVAMKDFPKHLPQQRALSAPARASASDPVGQARSIDPAGITLK